MSHVKRLTERGDWVFLSIAVTLLILGLVILSSASSALAFSIFNDSFHFLKQQSIWAVLGIAVMFFFMIFDYQKLRPFAFPLLLISYALLIALFIPGVGAVRNNVRSWIDIGSFSFQPVELVKLFLIIFLSTRFSEVALKSVKTIAGGVKPFLYTTVPILFLIFIQPDFGSMVVVFSIAFFIFFISGANALHIAYIVAASFLSIPLLIIFEPYKFERLTSFLNPTGDLAGSGYHLHQALIAIGSGGWFGKGYGKSVQKLQYLPEVAGDSIFAVVGEEMGFFGSIFIVILFFVLIFRGLKIASNSSDLFGKLLAVGIISWIAIQTFLNIGAITGLLPITGLPLPFISQGGTSLITLLAGIGIIFNISRQTPRPFIH